MVARAEPRNARRFSGKPVAITLGIVLVVGTAVTTYFAWQGELGRQRAFEAGAPPLAPPP